MSTSGSSMSLPFVGDPSDEILRVEGLTKHYTSRSGTFGGARQRVGAVEQVSFNLLDGETLGLVGESGCGKTTLSRMILRLIKPTSGRIFFEGKDVTEIGGAELRRMRQSVQVVFQDPYASLDPRRTVQYTIAEPLIPTGASRKERKQIAIDLMERLGMNPAHAHRYPHQFSGGQRQRIGIARALSVKPRLLILDEPVSALDVSIQAQVLNLLEDLRSDYDLSYILISHDLAVVRHASDRVAVMYLGRLVEVGERHQIFTAPRHPYTRSLLAGIPIADPKIERQRERIAPIGDVPNPADPPSGCTFHPRCSRVREIAGRLDSSEIVDVDGSMVPKRCNEAVPGLDPRGGPLGWSACHFSLDTGPDPTVDSEPGPKHDFTSDGVATLQGILGDDVISENDP